MVYWSMYKHIKEYIHYIYTYLMTCQAQGHIMKQCSIINN